MKERTLEDRLREVEATLNGPKGERIGFYFACGLTVIVSLYLLVQLVIANQRF